MREALQGVQVDMATTKIGHCIRIYANVKVCRGSATIAAISRKSNRALIERLSKGGNNGGDAIDAHRTRGECHFRNRILRIRSRASERTLQRRGGAGTSNTRTRGENVRRARIIDVDAQAVRTSIPVAPSRRCARSRSRRTARRHG